MSERENGNSLMWFLAGLGFGALLGVLYAPRSGRETREAIRSTAAEGKDYIKTRSREARDAVGQWVERGKEVVNRQTEQFGRAADAMRQAYHETTTEGQKGKQS